MGVECRFGYYERFSFFIGAKEGYEDSERLFEVLLHRKKSGTRNRGLVRRFNYYERFSFFIVAKEGYDHYGEDAGDSNSAIWRMANGELGVGSLVRIGVLLWQDGL